MNIAYLIAGIIGAVGFVICTAIGVLYISMRDYPDGILCVLLGFTDLALTFVWLARCLS